MESENQGASFAMDDCSAPDESGTLADDGGTGLTQGLDVEVSSTAVELPGRYKEMREYGCGGIGRVLLVRDLHLGREIALKELTADAAPDGATVDDEDASGAVTPAAARFLREARITAQLAHPSIVPVYELGRRSNGTLYYTMKLLRGRTLEQAVAQAGSLHTRLGLLPRVLDVCQAIAYSHSRGIIHRDIKPSNVMIGEFGETIVIDWGLAKTTGGEDVSSPRLSEAEDEQPDVKDPKLTRYGQHLGTPHYMSPEQAAGDLDSTDERSDVYQLGAVLYEVITGKRPFEGATAEEIIGRVLTEAPTPIRALEPEAPADLVAICERAMRKKPEHRYRSAKELVEELHRFQTGALVEAHRYTRLERLRRFVRRHRMGLATGTAALIALVTAGTLALAGILREHAQTERALYHSSISLAKSAFDNRRLEQTHAALEEAPRPYRHMEWGLLEQLSHPELLTLRGHTGMLMQAEFSPNGNTVATCGQDGRLILWNAQTGEQQTAIMVARDDEIHKVDWSHDGRLLVTATRQEQIALWDAKTCASVQKLSGYAPVFSPDGKMLAAATDEGLCVTLYDVVSGAVLEKLKGPAKYVVRIEFSMDGRRVAAAVSEGSVWVWDVNSGPVWHAEGAHAPSARWATFSPDGATLLTAGADRAARLWDAATGERLRTFEGHGGGIHAARFTGDGRQMITCSQDRTARVWDVATGEVLAVHDGFAQPLGYIGLSPDGTRFVTNGAGHTAVVRRVVPPDDLYTLKGYKARINALAFSPDASLVAGCAGTLLEKNDNRVIVWDTETCQVWRTIETDARNNYSACFLPDGRHIVVGSFNKTAVTYDIDTGKVERVFEGHSREVGSVAISPDGRMLATGSRDGSSALWDVESGRRLATLDGGAAYTLENDTVEDDVLEVSFSPRGGLVATGKRGGAVTFWDTATGKPIRVLPTLQKELFTFAFTSDGQWLATGGFDGTIKVWSVNTGRLHRTLRGHEGFIHALAFTSDGRRVASGSKDNSIRIWDVDSGREILLLDRHEERVRCLAISPDDRFLATGSDDGTAVLWPVRSWQPTQ